MDTRSYQELCSEGTKGIEMLDFEYAGKKFEESIAAIPAGTHFADPFFYRLLLQDSFGWTEDEKQKTAAAALEHDPQVLARFDQLMAAIPNFRDALAPQAIERLRGYLSKS